MSGAQLSHPTSGAPSPPAISFAFLHTPHPMSPQEDRREEGRGKKGSAAMDSWRQTVLGTPPFALKKRRRVVRSPLIRSMFLAILDVIPVPAFYDAESILVHRFLDCSCGLIGMAMVNSSSL
jgi:hypothetical protein